MRLLALLLCFAVAAAGLWALLGALLRPARRRDVALLGVAALALAPAATAWLFSLLLRVLPGERIGVYAIGTLVLPGILLAVAAWRWKPWRVAGGGGDAEANSSRRPWIATGLVAVAAALLIPVTAVTPLYENDALEYATVARLIREHASLEVYPALDSSRTKGFYGPWTHPAGYPSLLALAGMLQGDRTELRLARAVPLCASLALLLLVGVVGRGASGTLAAAVLLGTPIYLISTINMWTDPARVAAGAASVVVAFVFFSASGVPLWRAVLALGIALGLTFFMHSIGIVVIAMVGALILIWGEGSVARRLLTAAGAAGVALVMVAPDVVTNVRNFGAIVADAPPVWKIPELGYSDWMLMARDLYSPEGKLVNGLLVGFSQTYHYGASYVLAVAGAVLALRRVRRAGLVAFLRGPRAQFVAASEETRWLLVCGAIILFWAGCAVVTTLAGFFEFIKNVRYPYTVHPFVALLAGIGIGQFVGAGRRDGSRGRRALMRGLRGAAVLAIVLWMLMPLVRYANYLRDILGLHGGWRELSDVERLETVRLNTVHGVKAIDERMADDECVLLFRQADYAFYGRGCYFSYLDSRLIPLYLATSSDEIRAILDRHRIRWVFLPSYNLPEYYNSRLEAFLADPRDAALEWDLDQARIYRVPREASAARLERFTTLRLGQDQPLHDQQGVEGLTISQSRGAPFTTELVSAPSSVDPRLARDPHRAVPFSAWCGIPVLTPTLHGFEVTVSGTGYLYVVALTGAMYIDEQDAVGRRWQMIWDGALRGQRTIRGQFLVEPGQCLPLELRFSLRGAGHVTVERGTVFEFRGWPPPAGAFPWQAAMVRDWTASAGGRFQRSWKWGRADDGEYFAESYPHPGVPVTLRAPISEPVGETKAGFKSVPARATIEMSGTGRVQVVASVHLGRHAAIEGKETSKLLKLVKAAEPSASIAGDLDGLRKVVDALWNGASNAMLPIDEVGEVPLRTGHVQEVRRRVLFDGALDPQPGVYDFPLVVEPGDRIQISFLLPPRRRDEAGASVRIRHLVIDSGPEGRPRVLFDSRAW